MSLEVLRLAQLTALRMTGSYGSLPACPPYTRDCPTTPLPINQEKQARLSGLTIARYSSRVQSAKWLSASRWGTGVAVSALALALAPLAALAAAAARCASRRAFQASTKAALSWNTWRRAWYSSSPAWRRPYLLLRVSGWVVGGGDTWTYVADNSGGRAGGSGGRRDWEQVAPRPPHPPRHTHTQSGCTGDGCPQRKQHTTRLALLPQESTHAPVHKVVVMGVPPVHAGHVQRKGAAQRPRRVPAPLRRPPRSGGGSGGGSQGIGSSGFAVVCGDAFGQLKGFVVNGAGLVGMEGGNVLILVTACMVTRKIT